MGEKFLISYSCEVERTLEHCDLSPCVRIFDAKVHGDYHRYLEHCPFVVFDELDIGGFYDIIERSEVTIHKSRIGGLIYPTVDIGVYEMEDLECRKKERN